MDLYDEMTKLQDFSYSHIAYIILKTSLQVLVFL